ncbi:MAG: hypothetical protein M1831_003544 [Alyxoria varia]|nr:MAG: hypothetical protein M1831_003544 [Alyxoria varia]
MERYDIVIVGAGPVGLLLSMCLARWGYKIKHIDNRTEPTPTGRADGIQPRTLDLLKNLGLKGHIMSHNPAKVYEVAFWDPGTEGIQRTGTSASCPDFIDARYRFTALLHQGLIERVFIRDLEKNGVSVQRPWTIRGFENNGMDRTYPLEVQLSRVDAELESQTIRAKYLFSGEGAKSFIRQKLGIEIHHKDAISHVWGVVDGVIKTNFPDIKMKCTIHSDAGSVMVIPREANMVRLYIQLASSTDPDWDPRKTASPLEVQEAAKRVFKPYDIEWESVEWYSVYPIGQGIADRYTLDERVFLGGDACHTHSPKAGQGMNTAFLDAHNLAWKIHHVESGFAARSILSTYESERKNIAEALLEFDARYAKLFSERQSSQGPADQSSQEQSAEEENLFVRTFKENCEFTSGYGTLYPPDVLNWSTEQNASEYISSLFLRHPSDTRVCPGRLLRPANVTRVADANVVHLEQEVPTNGSWRLYLFCGNPSSGTIGNMLASFAQHATKPDSFLTSFLRSDIDSVTHHEQHNPHSLLYTFCVVFTGHRPDIAANLLDKGVVPPLLARYRNHIYADDVGDIRVPEIPMGGLGAAHKKMGLEDQPAVVVVRPDGFVGCVIRLVENGPGTADALNEYFGRFCGKRLGSKEEQSQSCSKPAARL